MTEICALPVAKICALYFTIYKPLSKKEKSRFAANIMLVITFVFVFLKSSREVFPSEEQLYNL